MATAHLASYTTPLASAPLPHAASPGNDQEWEEGDADDSVFFGGDGTHVTSPERRMQILLHGSCTKENEGDRRRDTLLVRKDDGRGVESPATPRQAVLGSLPNSRLRGTASSPAARTKNNLLSSPLLQSSPLRRQQDANAPSFSPILPRAFESLPAPSPALPRGPAAATMRFAETKAAGQQDFIDEAKEEDDTLLLDSVDVQVDDETEGDSMEESSEEVEEGESLVVSDDEAADGEDGELDSADVSEEEVEMDTVEETVVVLSHLVSDSTEHASTLDDSVATDSEVLVVEVEEDESTSSESLAQESQLEDTELESIIDEGMDDVDANGSVEEATDESVRTDDGEDDSVDASETAPDSPVTHTATLLQELVVSLPVEAPTSSTPPASPLLDSVALPSAPSPIVRASPRSSQTIMNGSPATSVGSSTPSAAERKPAAPAFAAPTAKRQLSKLTSRIATGTKKVVPDGTKRRSGLVAAPPATLVRSNMPVSGLPKRATPPTKVATLSRNVVPSSSTVAPAATVVSKVRPPPIAATKLGRLQTARPPIGTSKASVQAGNVVRSVGDAPEAITRPGSAQSTASSLSLASTVVPRPRVITKPSSLKLPTASASSKVGIARTGVPPLGRVVPASRPPVVKHGLGTSVSRPPISSSSSSSNSSIRPPTTTRPPTTASSTSLPRSALASSQVSRIKPGASAMRPPSTASTTLPPQAIPRHLPALAQTQSAPAILAGPEVQPNSLVAALKAPPMPLLPRPASTTALIASPKRRAQRAGGPPELVRAESEAIGGPSLSRVTPGLQRSLSTSALSSSTSSVPIRTTFAPLLSPTKAASHIDLAEASQPSALVAPADRIDADVVGEVFGAPSLDAAPMATLPRPQRTRTPTGDDELSTSTSTSRSTRRTATTSTPAVPLPPLPRPVRRAPAEVIVAEPLEPTLPPPSRLSERPILHFNPAPDLTSEELSTITQKNTKKNKTRYNKLDIQTIIIDTNRPPSPTSKIRKSLGSEGSLGRPTTKAGREARAEKRRSALRSSCDGSETALTSEELAEERRSSGIGSEMLVHYRAPGDDEEFCSPVRPSRSGKGKKKSSIAASLGGKRVRWDRALVYEGPLDDAQDEGDVDGILKNAVLDSFGNSKATTTDFGRRASVPVTKLVYKDDE